MQEQYFGSAHDLFTSGVVQEQGVLLSVKLFPGTDVNDKTVCLAQGLVVLLNFLQD